MKSHITLSSDACRDLYPYNSQSEFINLLPNVLENRDDKKFSLKLISIGLSTVVDGDDGVPSGYVKILVNEVEAQREGQEYTRFAGGFTYPPETSAGADYALHTFRHAPILPLRFHKLDKLRVSVIDIHNRPVSFLPGPATILQVELTSGMEEDGQFTLTCHSEDLLRFPGNSLSSFTYGLPSTLDLAGCEVSLLNIVYPPHLELKKDPVWIRLNRVRLDYNLDKYRNVETWLHKMTRDILRNDSIRNEFAISVSNQLHTGGLICVRRKRRMIAAGAPPQKEKMTMEVSPAFAKACGQHTTPVDKRRMSPGDVIYFNGKPNLARADPHPIAMLQCNLIRTNVLAGLQSNLLQTIPLLTDRRDNDLRMYEPKELTFHPVWNRPFDTIQFSLTEPDGTKKQFLPVHPGDGILVTLLFRHA